jgi:hypothetical protein
MALDCAHKHLCCGIADHKFSQRKSGWLSPNDEGVFHGAAERQGIRCAHPVQVDLNLKNHPERAAEAAEQFRKNLLSRENKRTVSLSDPATV